MGGGGKTTQKGVLNPPHTVRYVFHSHQVSVLCYSCTKFHDRADQKLFWRGPRIFRRARSLVRFAPPIRFAPPHITAQFNEAFAKNQSPEKVCEDAVSSLVFQDVGL